MIASSCIKIKTDKFPILEGEEEEIVNDNMYGKALCLYLERELPKLEIKVPFFCNEDWGWWLEVEDGDYSMALCIYSDPDADGNPESYAIMPSVREPKKWSWSKFRKIDVSAKVLKLMNKVADLFSKDKEITEISRHDDFPY
jgi:hypothetical protein